MVFLLNRRLSRRHARHALFAVLLTGAPLVLTAVAVTPAQASIPAPPSGFTTTWSDDFTGASGSGINSNWKYDTGAGSSFGTGEIETMTSSTSNVYQDGAGHLVLKALKDGSGNWTSGRVETTSNSFGAAPGGVVRMESVIQQPNVTTANGAGYWPAFWMLGEGLRTGGTWPNIGEVDILEDINGRSSVFGTLHCGTNPGGPCNESTGIGSGEHACAGCQTGFHDYAIEIDRSVSPEQIRYYLDGTNYFTITSTQVDATTWANAVDHNFYIIYDLAMGGSFPNSFGGGPTSSTVSGGTMVIDSVAVYNKAPAFSTSGVSATSTIQAESYNAQSSTQTEATTDSGGGSDVGYIGNGSWLKYDNVNFGSSGLHTFTGRVASGAPSGVSGTVEVHLDSLTNPSIGSFSVGNTGGWQTWTSTPGAISTTTGTHTVYLKFMTGSGQNFVNINWFTFS